MTRQIRTRHAAAAAVLAVVALTGIAPATAEGSGRWDRLDRWDPATPSPTGQSVAVECNSDDLATPETWPRATARLRLRERNGHSTLTLLIRNARPDTLYTIWVRIKGEDSNGDTYGGSPLTGIPVTPLAHTTELPAQLAATPPNPGSDTLANVFRTDRRGNGYLKL